MLWSMRLTVVPVVIGALGTVLKCLEKRLEELEIRGKIETIQFTTLFRSVLKTRGKLVSL